MELREQKTDAAPLKTTIYVPPGYRDLGQSAGMKIGTVSASLQALQISPDAIIGAGDVVVADRGAGGASNTCAGMHAAVWLLHVTVAGSAGRPAYVDPTTGAEAAFQREARALPSGPLRGGAPPASRAPFGAKIIDAKLTLSAGVLTNPIGRHVLWRASSRRGP